MISQQLAASASGGPALPAFESKEDSTAARVTVNVVSGHSPLDAICSDCLSLAMVSEPDSFTDLCLFRHHSETGLPRVQRMDQYLTGTGSFASAPTAIRCIREMAS
jgi:hypothetical protein